MKHEFPNIGFISRRLPDALYNSLRKECETAAKARYDSSVNKERFISGLSNKHVAEHYYVSDTKQQLNEFVMDVFNEFVNEFNYLSLFKFANKQMGFSFVNPWINIQEKYEYIPNHVHDGICSYAIWVKIPYNLEDEIGGNDQSVNSCLQFNYKDILGYDCSHTFKVDKEDEGMMIMFPSMLTHCVYPFYTSDDVRISVSGGVTYDPSKIIDR